MSEISTARMADGRQLPLIGLGLRLICSQRLPSVLGEAVRLGYRLVDTAQTYGNEEGIGTALRNGAIQRGDLFITTKIANRNQGRQLTIRSLEDSLQRLGTDVVELCLVHWPQPMYGQYVETWQTLIELRETGKVRSIGVSNFTAACLERIIAETGVVPAVNQIELHPQLPQDELLKFHAERGIVTQAWAPLGHGQLLAHPVVRVLAEEKGKTPGQVVLRWHLQRGVVPLPKSAKAEHMEDNLKFWDFDLTAHDMLRLSKLPARRFGPEPDLMAER